MTVRAAAHLFVTAAALQACLLAAPSIAPVETDIDLAFRQMYNLEFTAAHQSLARWKKARPEDPLGPVADAAAYLFAEFDRLKILQTEFFVQDDSFIHPKKLTPDPAVRDAFNRELANGERLAQAILPKNPRDGNALFASVLASGLRSDYQGLIEKRYLSSIGSMKEGREIANKLLAVDPACYDAWLAIGVENYILSLKPAPVRWLLRITGSATDRDEGIRVVRITAEKGHYLKPFARLLLAVAALRAKDNTQAKQILGDLVKQFPNNHLYAEELSRIR